MDDLIIPLDHEALLDFLLKADGPVQETELLKAFLGRDSGLNQGISLDLYRAHFILYHHLYRLKAELADSSWYLHIRSVNASLLRKPPRGECCHFDEEKGLFCRRKSGPASDYCPRHAEEMRRIKSEGRLDGPGMASYYLNPQNMKGMDGEKLERMTRGIFTYAATFDEAEAARDFMGLSPGYTRERLRRRFRYLSLKMHPDQAGGSGNEEDFRRLQDSYKLLSSIITQEETHGH